MVGCDSRPSAALLASIEHLIVHEEGDGSFERDSLDFIAAGRFTFGGAPIAMAVGTMANDAPIELIVWARGEIITGLELEPFKGTRLPIRMPILESIRPYPGPFGIEDGDEVAVSRARAACRARNSSTIWPKESERERNSTSRW